MPRNPYICLAIISTLGAALVIGVIGMIAISIMGREPSISIVAIVSSAAGSLSSFLVNVPRNQVGWEAPPASRSDGK